MSSKVWLWQILIRLVFPQANDFHVASYLVSGLWFFGTGAVEREINGYQVYLKRPKPNLTVIHFDTNAIIYMKTTWQTITGRLGKASKLPLYWACQLIKKEINQSMSQNCVFFVTFCIDTKVSMLYSYKINVIWMHRCTMEFHIFLCIFNNLIYALNLHFHENLVCIKITLGKLFELLHINLPT